MDEPPFVDPRSHNDDIETSLLAAASNTTSSDHQMMILWAHYNAWLDNHSHRGFTDEESGQQTGLETVEARRRCNNLRDAGFLEWTDERRPGIRYPTHPNQVSIITNVGRAKLGFAPVTPAPAPTPAPTPASPPDPFAEVRARLAKKHGR